MRRATPRVTAYGSSKTSKFVVEGLRVAGKRARKFFKTRRKAEAYLRKTLARIAKEGEGAVHMPESLRVEAVAAAEKLKPFGKTITDAVNHLVAHLEAVQRSCTVAALVLEFKQAKEKDGAAEMYLKDLKHRLAKFEDDFGLRMVADIKTPEVDDWLRGLDGAAQTRNNYRTVLRSVFEFAVVRSYAPDNPVAKTSKAKVVRGTPVVFTPDVFRTLLEKAPRDIVGYLTIGGFAGLRSIEIERLDWSQIDLAARLIDVKAKNAKSAQRRVVHISDNLAAWLAPLAQKSGPVVNLDRLRVARAKLVKDVGLPSWPGNVLRHSYASYHLAHHQDSARLAAELGHTSPVMLFKHYRQLVLPALAATWWQIVPPSDFGNVVAFQAEQG